MFPLRVSNKAASAIYRNSIPQATEDEFLIEKTPTYSQQFGGGKDGFKGRERTKHIAREMHNLMPNVKLFMFVTDPVDRIYSHIKESFKSFVHFFLDR